MLTEVGEVLPQVYLYVEADWHCFFKELIT